MTRSSMNCGGMLVAWMLALGCASGDPVPIPEAERIYLGDVVTVDADDRVAEAVALRGGRILAVGDRDDVFLHRGDGTEIVELGGRALLPGFIDGHSHLFYTALKLGMADMSPPPAGSVDDFDAIRAGLLEHAETLAPDAWLVGWGYDHSRLAEGRHPTRDDLDAISAERPIVLVHFSSHQAVVNTPALEALGYGPETPDPPGGVIVRRPGSREPNGILLERAWIPAFARITEADVDTRLERLERADARYAS